MRPRRFCRGKLLPQDGDGEAWLGFNEAPAILPGKERLPGLSRKHPDFASMRPRRFCRGKAASFLPPDPGLKRFNEAPAILPGKDPPVPYSATPENPLQ